MKCFKITNHNCELYKKCYDLRKRELEIEKRNNERVHKIVGDDWDFFAGWKGQQNFHRVTSYHAFYFNHPEQLSNAWREHKEYKGAFIPNIRTKAGRKIAEELNKLEKSCFRRVFEIFGLETVGRFMFPYMEIANNGDIVLAIDDNQDIKSFGDVVEITMTEINKMMEGGEQ